MSDDRLPRYETQKKNRENCGARPPIVRSFTSEPAILRDIDGRLYLVASRSTEEHGNMTRSFLVGVASAATVLGLVGCGGPAGFGVEDPTVTESPLGSFNVLTRNYDNLRSGANLAETTLNTTNVNSSQFGRLFKLSVDDQVYAGLLYASGVSIAGGTHNVVYVATGNNTIYAFDADSGGSPLWQRNFNGGGVAVFHTQVGFVDPWCNPYNDFSGTIGIVGTPVIEGTAGTMYFVTRTQI